MKKRTLLATILSLVICLGIAMPAWAAEKEMGLEYINEGQTVLSIGNEEIPVTSYVNDPLETADVEEFYKHAQSVISDEMILAQNDIDKPVAECFDYTLITDDATYFYEENANGKNIKIFETLIEKDLQNNIASQSYEDIIDDGIGGRQKINKNSGSYISGKIQTPTRNQVVGINNKIGADSICNYIYSGFSGKTTSGNSIGSDIGLQFAIKDPSIGGWNHYFLLDIAGTKYKVDIPSDENNNLYGQVYNQNFFLTSDATHTRYIYFTTYPNYNNTGVIRSKLEGYARYDNAEGQGTPDAYWKISIKEYNKPVASIANWKLLNTITNENATNVKSWCKISDITIDGNAISKSLLANPEEEYATVNRTFSGDNLSTLTISVDK